MKYDEFMKMMSSEKTRRKPRHLESAIQQSCVVWFRSTYPTYVIFSVPNGGSRNSLEAANLKKEGALSGASDLVIVIERAVLFVEMKSEKGRQQESQKEFQRKVERLGHQYCVCHSLKEFQLTVERFIKSKYGYDANAAETPNQ